MRLDEQASAHQGRVALAARAGERGVEAVARAVPRPGAVGAQVARVALSALLALVRPALGAGNDAQSVLDAATTYGRRRAEYA